MDQHVTDGAALLAVAPAVDVLGDRVVEAEEAPFPEVQDGDGGERLARRVPEHDVVGAQRPPGPGFADGHVEQDLALERDVDLGAVVEVLSLLVFEDLDDSREVEVTRVKSGDHSAEA